MGKRAVLDPIYTLKSTGWGSRSTAIAIQRIVREEGPQCVSVDEDGTVFATPANHDFSRALMKSHAGHVVGVYDSNLSMEDLAEDLIAQITSA